MPAPEVSKTIVVHELSLESSTDLLERAVSSSQDVSGATFLPDLPKCSECIMDINKSFKLNDLKYGGSLTA